MINGNGKREPLSNLQENQDAFQGLAGSVVRTIEPYTEADTYALLTQLLTAFGNLIGSGPHFYAEETKHSFSLYNAIVGKTSRARKGTSWGHVLNLVTECDPEWAKRRIQHGLGSGEGLIHAVRDPTDTDRGVADKRLLLVEAEFGNTLRVMGRSGSILSPILREGWDTGKTLQVLTKNTATKATGAHISVIAHITKDELLSQLHPVEILGGLANRFLWTSVERSKLLPNGSRVPDQATAELRRELSVASVFARSAGEIQFTRKCRRLWRELYGLFDEPASGAYSASISRGEAQVRRLAGLYALMNCSSFIRRKELLAAYSLWTYCKASAYGLFSPVLKETDVWVRLRKILEAHPRGLTRTELVAALSHHVKASELSKSLESLRSEGYVNYKKEKTNGRPAERWFITPNST